MADVLRNVDPSAIVNHGTELPDLPRPHPDSTRPDLDAVGDPDAVVVEVDQAGGSLAVGFHELRGVKPNDVTAWIA
jgi:hypothetical protein